jgi:hypothetical protein
LTSPWTGEILESLKGAASVCAVTCLLDVIRPGPEPPAPEPPPPGKEQSPEKIIEEEEFPFKKAA